MSSLICLLKELLQNSAAKRRGDQHQKALSASFFYDKVKIKFRLSEKLFPIDFEIQLIVQSCNFSFGLTA